ncbi:MAG: S4 domain-containing protein [Candidatus Pacearchaeota archaeon]
MHIKRSKMPMTWPLPRKGKKTKFLAVPSHSFNNGISLLFVLRDMLGIVKNRKEARYMVLQKLIKVNNKVRMDENFPLRVLDVVTIGNENLNYKLEIVNKKFKLREISEKEAGIKIVKISGKKVLGKNKIQMNLDDGQNFLTKEKFSVGDSVIVNTKENKLEKIIPLKEGVIIEVTLGKHAGKRGKLVGFENLPREKNYIVKIEDREVPLPYKAILAVENGK